jgi:uncharacterized small protein (DUF1192 family)
MILTMLIAVAVGALSLGYAIGGAVERFILNPIQENIMSTESDALKTSLDIGAADADALGAVIVGLQAKVTAATAQLANGAAITIERDALKAQIADLNATIATLQAEVDATNAKNKANADALTAAAAA